MKTYQVGGKIQVTDVDGEVKTATIKRIGPVHADRQMATLDLHGQCRYCVLRTEEVSE